MMILKKALLFLIIFSLFGTLHPGKSVEEELPKEFDSRKQQLWKAVAKGKKALCKVAHTDEDWQDALHMALAYSPQENPVNFFTLQHIIGELKKRHPEIPENLKDRAVFFTVHAGNLNYILREFKPQENTVLEMINTSLKHVKGDHSTFLINYLLEQQPLAAPSKDYEAIKKTLIDLAKESSSLDEILIKAVGEVSKNDTDTSKHMILTRYLNDLLHPKTVIATVETATPPTRAQQKAITASHEPLLRSPQRDINLQHNQPLKDTSITIVKWGLSIGALVTTATLLARYFHRR